MAVFGPPESLPDFEVVACRTTAEAAGCNLAWIPEGSRVDGRRLRKDLDRRGVPLASTSDTVPDGVAALSVLPDPESLGRRAAALVLGHLRDRKPVAPVAAVSRLRVTIDLRAARAAGHAVPLPALARADAVRRGR
ncbi:MAG: hypothetical protein ACE5JG_03650 [Planctomycetota bacterium]